MNAYATPSPLRLMLFVDAQNAYRGARGSFFRNDAPAAAGQFDPMELGKVIESRGGPSGAACVLKAVRIYTGRPDATKDPSTYAAHMRQCAAWEAGGAAVIWRSLRYPRGWPGERAQEKGVDVALAIDFVTLAVAEEFDVGVIMSTDNDFAPALEFVQRRYRGVRYVAVAGWQGSRQRGNRQIYTRSDGVWRHWLTRQDYDAVADWTAYGRRRSANESRTLGQ